MKPNIKSSFICLRGGGTAPQVKPTDLVDYRNKGNRGHYTPKPFPNIIYILYQENLWGDFRKARGKTIWSN